MHTGVYDMGGILLSYYEILRSSKSQKYINQCFAGF